VINRGIDLRELHKQHFACFACRKSFKRPGSEESSLPDALPLRSFPCPECGERMVVMGRDFEAPPQRDGRGWFVAELLHSFGIIFEPGICGPGHRPRRLRDAVEFLVKEGHEAGVVERRLREIRASRRA
jgi:hypothetical protein